MQEKAFEKQSLERLKKTNYPPIDPYVSGTEHLENMFSNTQKYTSLMFK
jgi:hypothetical protein